MPLLQLVVVLVVVGVCLYLLEMVPMDGTIKTIIRVVVILFVVLWVLQAVGLFDTFSTVRIGPGPRVR